MSSQPQPALLEVEEVGGVTLARFTRAHLLDEAVIQAVGRQLAALTGPGGPARVVLSFRGVDRFGSSLLAKVIGMHQRVKAAGGRLAVCAVALHLQEVFRITQLDRMLALYPTEQEALQSFGE